MTKKATVYDVAERAGVSIATVSRVLRQPDAVRPVTRERVLDSVAALGYVPSGSARGLAAVSYTHLRAHETEADPRDRG